MNTGYRIQDTGYRIQDIELNKQGFDATWDTDATATICIVPFDIDTRKLIPGHVELDPVEFSEKRPAVRVLLIF